MQIMRHASRRVVAAHPAIYLPVARRRYPGSVLDYSTELVIDGFTRSAVTFAVVAFQLAQNDHVRVAHHLHSSGHLVAAARRGTPILLPIRSPDDTILSALIREPLVPPAQFLKSFAAFYERLVPYRSAFVIASFDDVTSDFGAVIRRVNATFGAHFAEFQHNRSNVDACFELIEERSRRPPWERQLGAFLSGRMSFDEYRAASQTARTAAQLRAVPEHRVQRPSELRQARKEELKARFEAPRLKGLRQRADRAFALFSGGS